MKVLIIDDEENIRIYIRKLIEKVLKSELQNCRNL